MFEELEGGVVLRDLIEEVLRDGPRSISQVGKALAERGLKLHRLAVAGYLKALADTGLLDEREIPPAKVYALRPAAAKRDLYRMLADQAHGAEGLDPARVFLQALHELFLRPVFRTELKRGGFEPPPLVEEIDADARQQFRRQLSKTPLKLPFNDPAYRPNFSSPADEERVRNAARAALAALVRADHRVGALAVTTKQATLGGSD